MAAKLQIKVLGSKRTQRALAGMAEDMRAETKKQLARAIIAMEKTAKEKCPVDTGRLRSSIRLRFLREGFAADLFTDVDYAPHVEFGTRRQRAQPFMRPAFVEHRDKIPARFRRSAKIVVEQAAKRAKR